MEYGHHWPCFYARILFVTESNVPFFLFPLPILRLRDFSTSLGLAVTYSSRAVYPHVHTSAGSLQGKWFTDFAFSKAITKVDCLEHDEIHEKDTLT